MNVFFVLFAIVLILLYKSLYKSLFENVLYHGVEIIYYINLDHRDDRKNKFLNEMKKADFPDNMINRIPAVYNIERGDIGCSKSHILTLEKFIKSGYSNCIIFEDDFEFTQNKNQILQTLDNLKNISYDVVMISANEYDVKNTIYPWLKKVYGAQTTSGYMVSRSFAPTLLENFKEGCYMLEKTGEGAKYAVDQYWKKLQPTSDWYIVEPKLGKQGNSYSDIAKVVVDYKV